MPIPDLTPEQIAERRSKLLEAIRAALSLASDLEEQDPNPPTWGQYCDILNCLDEAAEPLRPDAEKVFSSEQWRDWKPVPGLYWCQICRKTRRRQHCRACWTDGLRRVFVMCEPGEDPAGEGE